MKAKRENIVSKERHRLEEVLPLEFPYSLAIDPCNLCNFKCKFCAMQSSKEENLYKKQFMDLDLFIKIIDDLGEFSEKLKVLRLNGQGEPLLNHEIVNMIHYAKKQQVADYIEIITNGSKLNPQLNMQLVEAGIDRIRISVEEISTEGYAEMAGQKINFEEFVANIKDLHERSENKCEIYIKIVDAAVNTEGKRKLFYDIFENICDKIWIDQVIPLWSDYEELKRYFNIGSVGMHGQKIQPINVCPYPFYSLIINPDGEVTACCADWKRKMVFGNLKQQSFKEIWNGKILKTFWRDMLKGNKNMYEMCAKCVLPMYDCNDNIDEYASMILERLEKGFEVNM